MQKPIHIAIGSTMSMPGDLAGNLRQIRSFAERAAEDGANLLLTPEMSACGYGAYPEVLATAEVAGAGPIYRDLAHIARLTGVVICAGFVEAYGEKRYLAHYVLDPTGDFRVQRKNRVTPAERPLDAAVSLTPPSGQDLIGQPAEPPVFTYFDVCGVRCAIAICADGGIDGLYDILAEHGVELLLGPAGAGGRREDRVVTADLRTAEGRKTYLDQLESVVFPVPRETVSACIQYGRAIAAVNQCGYDGKAMYHLGHGFIINSMGEILGLIPGLPNLDRQRPMYTHALVDVADRVAMG